MDDNTAICWYIFFTLSPLWIIAALAILWALVFEIDWESIWKSVFWKKIFSWKTIGICAVCFICWQAYNARVSYEKMNSAKIAAYEKL